LEAFTDFGVFSFIKKEPGYREKLLNEVQRAFREEIRINFNLKYEEGSDDVLMDVVKDIYWSDLSTVHPEFLVAQAQDIFGKLFRNAESVYLSKLSPGFSGAGLVMVTPIWSGSGLGPSRVVKVDRIDKAQNEKNNYELHVRHFMPLAATQVSYGHCQHLGAALFSFAEDASVKFMEFDEYYRKSGVKEVQDSLHNLIRMTCRYWYDHTRSQPANLQNLYFHAFNLTVDKLTERIQTLMPDFDPELPDCQLPGSDTRLLNPLYWLKTHQRQSVLAVKMCITHGDMTGRNIMVDGNGKCWMIDFLRTYESHSLRDFVILETDLLYRLGPLLPDKDFLDLEKHLLRQGVRNNEARPLPRWDKETKKLFSVILTVRELAYQMAFGVANPSQMDFEYTLSLLMATLNVIRLRHIHLDRKLQALRAAILICERLDGNQSG
jgi:hypothetical protein